MGVTDFDKVRVGGEYVPSRLPVTFRQEANGVLADAVFFTADRAYTVVAVKESHSTAATATAGQYLQIEKCTGTVAAGSGSNLLTDNSDSGISLTTAANTSQSGTLSTTAGLCDLAEGDRLAIDYSATTAPLAGVQVTVLLRPKES